MEYPNLSFHVHQILSALQDISNHLIYLPEQNREVVSASLHHLSEDLNEMVSDIDAHSGTPTLANEYAASDKMVDVSPFDRRETVEVFDHYIVLNVDGEFTYANPFAFTMGDHIKDVVVEIRNICSELRPPALSRLNLKDAIQENIADFWSGCKNALRRLAEPYRLFLDLGKVPQCR